MGDDSLRVKRTVPVGLVAASVVLVAACSSQGDGASETNDDPATVVTTTAQPGAAETTTTDQPGAAETTTPPQPAVELVWSRVAHDESVFGGNATQRLRAVAASQSGLVAVGFDTSGGDFDAAVWTSPDGVVWSRVAHDESVFGGNDTQTMRSVAVSASGFVAVGNDKSGGDFEAAVWTSADGVVWSRVAHDELAFGGPGNQQMDSVAATGSGFVAVGLDQLDDDIDAAVWTSPDGVVWSRVPHNEAVFGGDATQEMNSVVATDSGFIAVGEDWSGGDPDAAVWTSPDGVVWSRVAHDEAVFGGDDSQKTMSVTAGGSGFVAVGMDKSGGDFDAAVWTSPDGVVWSRVAHDEAVFGGQENQQMDDVVLLAGFGFVAVGLEESNEDWDTAVWTSPDGVVWSRVPHDEVVFGGEANQQAVSVVAWESGVVAVGDEESGGDFDAALWAVVQ